MKENGDNIKEIDASKHKLKKIYSLVDANGAYIKGKIDGINNKMHSEKINLKVKESDFVFANVSFNFYRHGLGRNQLMCKVMSDSVKNICYPPEGLQRLLRADEAVISTLQLTSLFEIKQDGHVDFFTEFSFKKEYNVPKDETYPQFKDYVMYLSHYRRD